MAEGATTRGLVTALSPLTVRSDGSATAVPAMWGGPSTGAVAGSSRVQVQTRDPWQPIITLVEVT